MAKRTVADDLQRIPGVGPSIARDLRGLGIRRVSDLKGRDPEALYEQSNARRGDTAGPVPALRVPLRGLLREHGAARPGAAEVVVVEGPGREAQPQGSTRDMIIRP